MNIGKIDNMENTNNIYNGQLSVTKIQESSSNNLEVGAVYENISSQSMVIGLYTAAATSTSDQYENYHLQGYLASLKFYVGPTDGYLTSELSKKAIKNFQKVYGLTETGIMDKTTKSKLNAAYTMKDNITRNSAIDNIVKKLSLDSRQKDTLLNTWTFLRNGMGLNQKQAAGVCGNLYAESRFAEDNAQDSSYPGTHNSDYKYSSTDSVGYGLMQWTLKSRKKGLSSMADSMDLAVSDINAQLSYFRKEMTSDFKTAWSKIKAATSYNDASDIFLEKIEQPAKNNYSERRGYSKTVYDYLKSY